MRSWRPSRPSPAMIVALVALCAVLGGSAVAAKKIVRAPKNSVNSAAVINNSLRLKDFKKSERAKLKGAKGDTGLAGTPDGFTKAEADGRFLGGTAKAADADKLDGVDASGYTQGGGSQQSGFRILADGTNVSDLVALPGIGSIGVHCGSSMSLDLAISSDVSDAVQWEENDNGTLSSHTSVAGSGVSFLLGSTSHQITAQFHRSHAPSIAVIEQDNVTLIMSIFRGASGDNASDCRVHAQVVDSHQSATLALP
jgi:hypothetical protein